MLGNNHIHINNELCNNRECRAIRIFQAQGQQPMARAFDVVKYTRAKKRTSQYSVMSLHVVDLLGLFLLSFQFRLIFIVDTEKNFVDAADTSPTIVAVCDINEHS